MAQGTSKTTNSIRLGVDVGGTFTDFVLVDDNRGRIFTGKRLTTPADPSVAMLEGIDQLLNEASVDIGEVDRIVHGTTLVTNTVIERKGAKVGLITTKGFRDVAEMGREIRYDLYDLFLEKPAPLVSRYLRREVDERIDADGCVIRSFDAEGFRSEVRFLVEQGVEAIAVCFLHSYRNPNHEREAGRILGAEFPQLLSTLSSEVAPEIREYERGNTAAANAYVQPLMNKYLERLGDGLAAMGSKGALSVMLSGGGITTLRMARRFPVQLIESGPAAGATAACVYAKLTGEDHIISFDMGGTTAKMCLIENGVPEYANEFEAARVRRFRKGSGLMLRVPVIDLIEIGAGGGSTAWIDAMGLLKIGPESAGAEPGPVCYRRGGTIPAVTDADLMLGYLSSEFFLGGEMALDLKLVRDAIEKKIAIPLGLSVEEAAAGMHSIVNENMAAATRMHIAEKGKDSRHYTMIAFGGAGPVHAYGLAKLLKLKRVICPLGAGVMSALGLLAAPAALDLVRSYVTRLERIDWPHLQSLFGEMETEAHGLLVEAGADVEEIRLQRRANMRHVGQGFEISVPIPSGLLTAGSLDAMRDSFFKTYEGLFERRLPEIPIEVLNWRVHASTALPHIALDFEGQRQNSGNPVKGRRRVHFPETGYVLCTIYNRYALEIGESFRGPAVIEERESTTVVGPDATITVDAHFNLVIEIDQLNAKDDEAHAVATEVTGA